MFVAVTDIDYGSMDAQRRSAFIHNRHSSNTTSQIDKLMQHITIPNTDLTVSPICLGCANLGVKNTEEEAFALLDAFTASGGNFLDTARVYSNWIPGELNRSERIIGDWLDSRNNRDRIVLATKGAHPILGTTDDRLSSSHIEADLLGSLESLRASIIDLYYLHRDEPGRPVAEIIDTLHMHQQAGRIGHYACSNWHPDRIVEAQTYAHSNGMSGFVANQMRWSLAGMSVGPPKDPTMRAMDASTYDLHIESGLAAIPFGSQAGGYFTKLAVDPASAEKSAFHNEANQNLLQTLQSGASANATITQIALAWLIAQPFTTIPIIGSRNLGQLKDSLPAAGIVLPNELLDALNRAVQSAS
jgi:aryl-alcohol dehydrogenase-like predicted oxidoreductase